MSNITKYGDISPRTAAYAAKKLLSRGQYMTFLERFGQTDPQGKNKTKTRTWRRYESLNRALSPLAEGVTPAGQRLSKTDYTAVLEQYGDWVQITDVIADTHEDPVLSEAVDLCGEQIAETVELIRFNILKAGTNVFYAGAATSRATVDATITAGKIRSIVRAFYRAKGKRFTKIVKATASIATEPVAEAFFALAHTDLESDIRNMTGFVPTEKYSSSDKALPGEVGKVENVRFILSPLFQPWEVAGASSTTWLSGGVPVTSAAAADVYPVLFFAMDAYGIVPLQGSNAVTPMVSNPGKPSPGDPLGQRGFVSWKTYQTAAILNESWMARLECAATAVPS